MSLTLIDDVINENFIASLSLESTANENIVIQPNEAMIQITDNDGKSPSFSVFQTLFCLTWQVQFMRYCIYRCPDWIPANS